MASQDPEVQNPDRKRRLEAAVECPICIKPFTEKVFQCHEGHLICENCVSGLSKMTEIVSFSDSMRCPTCRISLLPLIRNRALEDIAVLDPSEELEIFQTRKEARVEELDVVREATGHARKELEQVQKKMADGKKELAQVQSKLANAKKEVRSGAAEPAKAHAEIGRVADLLNSMKKVDTSHLYQGEKKMVDEWKTRTLAEALGVKK